MSSLLEFRLLTSDFVLTLIDSGKFGASKCILSSFSYLGLLLGSCNLSNVYRSILDYTFLPVY